MRMLEGVWFGKKMCVLYIHLQFFVGPTTKKLVWFCYLYSVLIFSTQESVLNTENENKFGHIHL